MGMNESWGGQARTNNEVAVRMGTVQDNLLTLEIST